MCAAFRGEGMKDSTRGSGHGAARGVTLRRLRHAAPVGEETGYRLRRRHELRDAYVLVGGVRDVDVPGAVHDTGHPAEADEKPHVRAVGDALDDGLLAGSPLVGS